MRLKNVHGEKGNLQVVAVVKLVEGGNLPPKRRSSIASEYKHYGLTRGQCRQLNAGTLVQLVQGKIWRCIASV
jgi:hypothetical protein